MSSHFVGMFQRNESTARSKFGVMTNLVSKQIHFSKRISMMHIDEVVLLEHSLHKSQSPPSGSESITLQTIEAIAFLHIPTLDPSRWLLLSFDCCQLNHPSLCQLYFRGAHQHMPFLTCDLKRITSISKKKVKFGKTKGNRIRKTCM